MIAHSQPSLGKEEARAVDCVLKSGHVADPASFERALTKVLGKRAHAVQSGSAALHLALLALGVRKGDRVSIPSYTCMAVLNAVRYVGATPVFEDCDPASGNVVEFSPARVTLVAHMFGLPGPLPGAKLVIEDFAMALGARKPRGPAIGSFYATKVITTGHGGFVAGLDVSDLTDYDNRDDVSVRYNYRMSGIAAAIGEVQLRKLPLFIKRRREIAEYYYKQFEGLPIDLPPRSRDHIYYRFVVRADRADDLMRHLKARGIEAKRPVYRPLHLYFPGNRGKYPGAEDLHRRAVSLPIYPTLSTRDRERVARAVRAFFR